MDAGSRRIGEDLYFLPRKTFRDNPDRFIPNRSAIDWDYAHYMPTEGKKIKVNPIETSPSSKAYQKLLAETFNMNRTRILAFRNKPPTPVEAIPTVQQAKPVKPRRYVSQDFNSKLGWLGSLAKHGFLVTSERTLAAVDMVNDYHLNLLDWGTGNVLAIALVNTVYLWDASNGSTSELVTIEDENCSVTSIKWAPDGQRIAVGLHNSDVQLWDSTSNQQGGHQSRVGALDWNNDGILTTGGMDGQIINNDMRIGDPIVSTYRGHHQEVCGLKWSGSGQKLASGGDDNLLHIWDRSMVSSTRYLYRLEDHTAAVRALSWSPFQSNLLASGGGDGDLSIKFWNTHTGACLNSIDTGTEVCSLLWNANEREILSSHGFPRNQLTLWKYPSMVKIAELTGHTSRVLFMTQSPDRCTVASAAGDEKLKFWNVFGTPGVARRTPNVNPERFAHFNHIR